MNNKQIRKLKVGSEVIINNDKYKIVAEDMGIKHTNEVKEWTLIDNKGDEYLLQLVMGKRLSLWSISIDPLSKSPIYNNQSLIKISSIK